MNSFRNVERAIEFEINRQTELVESGESVIQETLLWDASQNIAYPMRGKEEAHDYRYFPEPDLVPVHVDKNWIQEISSQLPEHPTVRRDRYIAELALPKYDADVLTSEKEYADFFETTLRELNTNKKEQAKTVSNWVMTDVLRVISEQKISIKDFRVTPANLANMIRLINNGVISGKIAKEVFEEMLKSNEDPKTIVEKKGLVQLSDESAIEKIVVEVLEKNKPQIEKYRAGNEKVFGFFVGEIMKATKGKANPAIVNVVLKKKLHLL
jgi:aspartyl-tRNA(Asn)/glutamyl-tRNA(Gln) amidotransferase subunit B